MKLTLLLLVETLSDSDYIMVYNYGANGTCTDNVVPANSSQRQFIQSCVGANPETVNISLCAACQHFNR